MADAAHGIKNSTIITAMARNGTEFGIKVSGLGDRWFTGPSPQIQGLYFSGHGPEHACPDMGDSAITETVGLGGLALATAPAFTRTVGGSIKDAIRYAKEMNEITVSKNREFVIPFLDSEGVPTGIDVRKVVETEITPVIDTAIAARKGGHFGVGISRPPIKPFQDALKAMSEWLA
jgi:hypothetical protein